MPLWVREWEVSCPYPLHLGLHVSAIVLCEGILHVNRKVTIRISYSRHDFLCLSMALVCDKNRYKLLLEGMLKNTEADHPDRPLLQNAIEQISDVASFINDSIKRRENQAKIWGMCDTQQRQQLV